MSISYPQSDLEALADITGYYRWIVRCFQPHLQGRVLELGAGTGNFTQQYVEGIEAAMLVEPAGHLVRELRTRFAQLPKVEVIEGDLDIATAHPTVRARAFDAVVSVNVLEHIEDDEGTVRQMARLLRPDGALLTFVPALPSLFGTLDTAVGHHRRYRRGDVAYLMERASLRVVSLTYFDILGVLPWLLAGRVLRQKRTSAAAAKLYDRLVVPVASRVERLISPPLGKNLVCVARR